MSSTPPSIPASLSSLPPRSRAVAAIALGLFSVHMALAERYGVFRDELYYVACGEHLAFGYVDHPPLVAVMAKLSRIVFGESLRGLRVLPALCAAATVLLAGEMARRLGGGRFAQALAALCTAVAPGFLGLDHFLSMNCVLPVAWTGAAILATDAVVFARPRAWLAFGAVCGAGLLAKHSTLFFGAAMAVGLLSTPHRRALATRGPWLAVAIAAVLIAPNVVWEITHGWPTLEFMHNAQEKKMVRFDALSFAKEVVLDMHPLSLPIWGCGLGWLLGSKRGRDARFLGVTVIALMAIVIAGGGKPYYATPVFPVLFAAGGVAVEAWVASLAARGAVVATIALGGAATAPLAIPLLGVETFRGYAAAIGVTPASDEKHDMGPLPQHFADQFGWEAMAERVAAAYGALSPEEQRVTALYGSNYGEAGAMDYFGPRWGLPRAVSGHNSYFFWGPPEGGRGEVLIAVGEDKEDLEETYAEVTEVGETDAPYAMPYENHVKIFLCRKPKLTLPQAWPSTRKFI